MRIAYLCYADAWSDDGVVRKIRGQVGRWRSRGHHVRLLFLSRDPSARPEPPPRAAPAIEADHFTFTGAASRVRATLAMARCARRFRPDVAYVRNDWYLPPLTVLLAGIPTVVEVNSDDRRESRLYGRGHAAYNEVNRLALRAMADGYVCVTRELTTTSAPGPAPRVVIANGIDSEAPPPSSRPDRGGVPLRAVMLVGARPTPSWNGVDKLFELAAAFPDLRIELVGPGADPELGTPPPNVNVHDLLAPECYAPILAEADFAFGPMALHRKGMSEASPLKVREYLLHGLPVVAAYEDTDFPGAPPWFMLRLPNTEDNVRRNAPRIHAWGLAMRGRRVPGDDVRDTLGADAKEDLRLAFLEEVRRRSGRRLVRRGGR